MSNVTQSYKVNIDIEYGKLRPIMDWCNTNCTGDWCFDDLVTSTTYHPDMYSYVFKFKNELDLVHFSLKFK